MDFNEYQAAAERTANRTTADDDNLRLANFALGLAGESGEVVEAVKKHLFHGRDLNRATMVKELGDALWYVATISSTLHIPLGEIAYANIEKLKQRYPNGFSVEDSLRRVDEQGGEQG